MNSIMLPLMHRSEMCVLFLALLSVSALIVDCAGFLTVIKYKCMCLIGQANL